MEKIKNLPIMLFASTMGFSGFVIVYEKLNLMFNISNLAFLVLRGFVSLVFLTIFLLYLFKIFTNFSEVKKEFYHPIKINFFAAFVITLLLLSIIWKDSFLYYIFYYTGAFLLTFLTFYILSF